MERPAQQRLVIFGCGYVGRAVAVEGLARGLEVTALTRNPATAADLEKIGVAVVVADLVGADWHAQIPGGADFVVNTVSAGGGGIEGYRHSYLAGMTSLLQWARERGTARTLVYTSSTSVYPQGSGVVVDEEAGHDGVTERGAVLLAAETVLRDGAPRDDESAGEQGAFVPYGRCFILRLAGIYGPGRHSLLEQVRRGEVAGRGEHRLNLIHRDDICSAIWAALLAPPEIRGGTFNLADDVPAPKQEVVEWLARRLAVGRPRFTQQPVGRRSALTPDRVISNAKIKRVLGWQPRFPDYRAGYGNILSRSPE